MAIAILELSNGGCSLEFAEADLPAIKSAIAELWGEATSQTYVAAQSVQFGGQEFTFQNEWDDPCLIASAAEGSAMLRQLANHLSRKTK